MSCATSRPAKLARDDSPWVKRLSWDASFSLQSLFDRLKHLPHCLWLDSATTGPRSDLGRYSFLTADPIETLVARVGDPDPWRQLERWCRQLPEEVDADLPPFQGGIAGLIGYEAMTWLESIEPAPNDDLPTPAMSLGLYDWTIAVDHLAQEAWIVCPGLGGCNLSERHALARKRLDQVEQWLQVEPVETSIDEDANAPSTIDTPSIAHQHSTTHPTITSSFSSDGYRDAVAEIVQRICAGDSFQVNLAQRLLCEANVASPELYRRLRTHNPAPFSVYYGGDDFAVLSSSPEGFLKVRGRRVETRPIKGTVARTGDEETDEALAETLLASEKDHAENVMIVDLMRNDLSRVCDAESVQVDELCAIEQYECVQHLVSVVSGRLSEDRSVVDLLRASFPGGSITGAPKIEAMKTIAQLEPNPRGPYCGTIGYISCGGSADFNILIRTITAAHGYWQIPVGGGITAKSDPASEEAETWDKAEGMLRAIRDHG